MKQELLEQQAIKRLENMITQEFDEHHSQEHNHSHGHSHETSCSVHDNGCNGNHHEHLDHGHEIGNHEHNPAVKCSLGHENCNDSHIEEEHVHHIDCGHNHALKADESKTKCRLGEDNCNDPHVQVEHEKHLDHGHDEKQHDTKQTFEIDEMKQGEKEQAKFEEALHVQKIKQEQEMMLREQTKQINPTQKKEYELNYDSKKQHIKKASTQKTEDTKTKINKSNNHYQKTTKVKKSKKQIQAPATETKVKKEELTLKIKSFNKEDETREEEQAEQQLTSQPTQVYEDIIRLYQDKKNDVVEQPQLEYESNTVTEQSDIELTMIDTYLAPIMENETPTDATDIVHKKSEPTKVDNEPIPSEVFSDAREEEIIKEDITTATSIVVVAAVKKLAKQTELENVKTESSSEVIIENITQDLKNILSNRYLKQEDIEKSFIEALQKADLPFDKDEIVFYINSYGLKFVKNVLESLKNIESYKTNSQLSSYSKLQEDSILLRIGRIAVQLLAIKHYAPTGA